MWLRSSTGFYSRFNLAMDRSHSFGSMYLDYGALFRLAFASAPSLLAINLAYIHNSPDRSTKSTRLRFLSSTACKHRVLGSISLPSRGSFHLSFTVLFSISHLGVFSLTEWSPHIHTRFLVSHTTLDTTSVSHTFVYRTITFFGRFFHSVPLAN